MSIFSCVLSTVLLLMMPPPPRSTRTDTLVPYTSLVRSLGLFEKTISVREPAIIRSHFNRSALMQIPCRQAMEALIQLDTVSTDILHRRRPDRAGNQCQIFQTVPALAYAMRDQIVPDLAGQTGRASCRERVC